jgi:hypothetical protein
MFWIKRLNKGAFRMAALSAEPPFVSNAALMINVSKGLEAGIRCGIHQ